MLLQYLISPVLAAPAFLDNLIRSTTLATSNTTISSGDPSSQLVPAPHDILKLLNASIVISGAAYCRPAEITAKVCRLCREPQFQRLTMIHHHSNDTAGLEWFTAVDISTDTVVISFKGSGGDNNWSTNLDWELVPLYPYGKDDSNTAHIHHGFYKAYWTAKNQMEESVAYAIKEYQKIRHISTVSSIMPTIWFTGHSSGACN